MSLLSPAMSTALDPSEETPLLRTMSKDSEHDVVAANHEEDRSIVSEDQVIQAYDESRKIGITGAVFLILNKMIGTGSELSDRNASEQELLT